ncbi:MAG: pirin family protein [Acidobacteriota bacterium]
MDSSGARVELTPTRMSVMNAGSGISHEEFIPADGAEAEMLQVFIRPRAEDLEPEVHFHDFPEATSLNAWRLIAGAERFQAPLTVRNEIALFDARLSKHSLTILEEPGWDSFLYVLSGQVLLNGEVMQTGDSALALDEAPGELLAEEAVDLVLFLFAKEAAVSLQGTRSGGGKVGGPLTALGG